MNSITFKDDDPELEKEELNKGACLVFRVVIVVGTQGHCLRFWGEGGWSLRPVQVEALPSLYAEAESMPQISWTSL